jgi:hypothetical protein
MGNTNDVTKIMQLLPKYMQALYNDSVLYFSDEETVATSERKAMLAKDIMMIEELLTFLKKNLA